MIVYADHYNHYNDNISLILTKKKEYPYGKMIFQISKFKTFNDYFKGKFFF